MYLIVGIVIGILLTVGAGILLLQHYCVGRLRIDHSIPEDNPYLFLEMSQSIDHLKGKKYVVLKVLEQNYISQKSQ